MGDVQTDVAALAGRLARTLEHLTMRADFARTAQALTTWAGQRATLPAGVWTDAAQQPLLDALARDLAAVHGRRAGPNVAGGSCNMGRSYQSTWGLTPLLCGYEGWAAFLGFTVRYMPHLVGASLKLTLALLRADATLVDVFKPMLKVWAATGQVPKSAH